jgi:hypothetical protein
MRLMGKNLKAVALGERVMLGILGKYWEHHVT